MVVPPKWLVYNRNSYQNIGYGGKTLEPKYGKVYLWITVNLIVPPLFYGYWKGTMWSPFK